MDSGVVERRRVRRRGVSGTSPVKTSQQSTTVDFRSRSFLCIVNQCTTPLPRASPTTLSLPSRCTSPALRDFQNRPDRLPLFMGLNSTLKIIPLFFFRSSHTGWETLRGRLPSSSRRVIVGRAPSDLASCTKDGLSRLGPVRRLDLRRHRGATEG